jgi:para-nitrobenzyl esterase
MTTVTTRNGPVTGTDSEGLCVFKGLPFAAPPVGENRWAAPQPVADWSEPRDATEFGSQSLQSATPMAAMFGGVQEQIAFAEDCLSLNIWTPACDAAARPVMVWIHGGAFILGSGSSPMYDGEAFARRGVVLVSINYRLGALGFLRLNDITKGAIPSTGNEGLLDQIAALRWVSENIAAFGGDPSNVTIFGESAGAMSVGSLMAMEEAQPLYDKAIPQSGACHTASPVERANQVAELTLDKLGVAPDDTEALIGATSEEILKAQEAVLAELSITGSQRIKGMPYQPVVDGAQLTELPIESIRSGSARGKAVLVGNTLEEMKLFTAMTPGPSDLTGLREALSESFSDAESEHLIDGYRSELEDRNVPAEPADIACAISTDRMFRMPGVRLAEAQLAHSKRVFMYLFDWRTEFMNMGACHALELAFVFGTHHHARLEPFFGGAKPGADELSDAMLSAWTSFATTGSPGGEDVPNYAHNRATLIFGANNTVEEDPHSRQRALWDELEDHIGQM